MKDAGLLSTEIEFIEKSFLALKNYCENEDYKGWDPYDGLNSKFFQSTPLKDWGLARLVWIQCFKRSPINLRRLLGVPKGYNSKGLGLFLSGYCNLYKLAVRGDIRFGSETEIMEIITRIADLLVEIKNNDYSGACWGYNFDWQSKAFFLPKDTPTVVATCFVVEALVEAYEITHNKVYLDVVLSSADFVVNDLNRIDKPDMSFMFSYSPLDNQAVYNATLLGTKILSLVYSYSKNEKLKGLAYKSAKAVCDLQNEDGSFPHSDQIGQSWRDNFHTGFKLDSLIVYQKLCSDNSFIVNIDKGFKYWVDSYFDHESGFSYYYDRGMARSLVDLHCAAQALSLLYRVGKSNQYNSLMNKIVMWSVDNMQSKKGSFDFQKNGYLRNKVVYMRWPNAWMFYGVSYWLVAGASR